MSITVKYRSIHPYQIIPAAKGRELDRFIDFPHVLYQRLLPPNPWVAPLQMSVKETISPAINPFFKQGGQLALFNVYARTDNSKHAMVARFGISYCPDFVQKWNSPRAFFGFYEQIENLKLAKHIFKFARDYAKSNFNADGLIGPVNLSTNYQLGMLMDKFDATPTYEMAYNPEYYIRMFEESGYWEKAMNLLAYEFFVDQKMDPKIERIIQMIQNRYDVTLRTINFDDYKNELEMLREIFNDAWSNNWGFIPMSKEEWAFLAKDLKKFVNEDLVLIGMIKGKPFGFSLVVPDLNQILKGVPNGRLFPTGIFKMLTGLKKIDHGRLITLGVKKKYQHLGLGSIFYIEAQRTGRKQGYKSGELSWVLESNHALVNSLKTVGARVSKNYRLFQTF